MAVQPSEAGNVDPLNGRKLGKGESLQLITRAVREDILSGRLRPGERIHQEAVAVRFGTSRSPVREALKMLQTEGLVLVLPNVGARVSRLDAAELEEVYWLREQIEPAALERSAPHLTAAQLASMREDVEEMDVVWDRSRDQAAVLAIDRRLHLRLLSGGNSSRLLQIVEGLWNVAAPYRFTFLTMRGDESLRTSQVEHRLILDALERGSGKDAARLLEVHIRRTALGLSANPEIFPE
jgi:DNA-binding GntR family transcriptional regulator